MKFLKLMEAINTRHLVGMAELSMLEVKLLLTFTIDVNEYNRIFYFTMFP